LKKSAIFSVGVPSGRPGKIRLRLAPSSGEVRRPARNAGAFMNGTMMTRPVIAVASSSRVNA
jgi:hypothetical protein